MLWAAVPETAVYEYGKTFGGKSDVRFAGQSVFEAITVSLVPERLAQKDLGLGVPAPDCAHAAAALFFGQNVGHFDKTVSYYCSISAQATVLPVADRRFFVLEALRCLRRTG